MNDDEPTVFTDVNRCLDALVAVLACGAMVAIAVVYLVVWRM